MVTSLINNQCVCFDVELTDMRLPSVEVFWVCAREEVQHSRANCITNNNIREKLINDKKDLSCRIALAAKCYIEQ